ncbi:caveolin-3 [Strongylocentrotus purpuratus]|uniref:Caveolin n=1 Tax=Strongylocentrotus purpuratus TaxID=7668 RepID=A0A7M7RAC4_STRPU|nr:caveolin-3-like [Strongylocentrotus purpuratus]XP_782608.1 caveolin-3 [Strongylocentrotus purpuratus]|eukprot:XP_782608.1 PREDICTED: caveolin-3 [Strongylocentrotus purpuratus]
MASDEQPIKQSDVALAVPQGLAMEDRDPDDINSHVKVSWHEIFAEPDGIHSQEQTWIKSYNTYNWSKNCCYSCCSTVCSIPAAFCWGVYFAILSFCHIWCVVPCIKAYMIKLVCATRSYAICIKAFCDPCYESVALMFSRIKVIFVPTTPEVAAEISYA